MEAASIFARVGLPSEVQQLGQRSIYAPPSAAFALVTSFALVTCGGAPRDSESEASFGKWPTPEECATPATDAEVATLADSLKTHVRSFKRNLSFYHWGKRGIGNGRSEIMYLRSPSKRDSSKLYAGPVPLRPFGLADYEPKLDFDLAKEYFEKIAGNFFQIGADEQSWWVGNGLYVAADPAMSNVYAGDPGFLLQVDVPEGLNFLDLRQRRGSPYLPFSGGAQAVAQAAFSKATACDGRLMGHYPVWMHSGMPTITKFLVTSYTRDIMKRVFLRLNVGVVASNWGGGAYSTCNKTADAAGVDFVFSDPGISDRLGFKVFVDELEESPSREKAVEYERVRRLLDAANATGVPFLGPTYFTRRGRDAFTRDWSEVFQKNQFDFSDVPQTDVTQLFGCSSDPRYLEETRFRGAN